MRIYYHEVMRLRIYVQSDCFSIPKGLRPRFVTVRRIHLQTLRHYSPDRWVFPTCAGISTTDIAPKTASREQNLASPFLRQDIVQSSHKTSVVWEMVLAKVPTRGCHPPLGHLKIISFGGYCLLSS